MGSVSPLNDNGSSGTIKLQVMNPLKDRNDILSCYFVAKLNITSLFLNNVDDPSRSLLHTLKWRR